MNYTHHVVENEQSDHEPILRIWRELHEREEQSLSQDAPSEEQEGTDATQAFN